MKIVLASVMQCLEYHGTPPNHLVFVAGVECVGVFGFLMFLSVVLRWGHARSFRTRKLSLSAPMVLHSGGCGRVGRRRHHNLNNGAGYVLQLVEVDGLEFSQVEDFTRLQDVPRILYVRADSVHHPVYQ